MQLGGDNLRAVLQLLLVALMKKLWLWKNGNHYWAFEHLYPCYPNGDPMTLGEPVGYALLKESVPREARAPRDPDLERPGIFRDHNCWKCKNGAGECVNGNPWQCEYPHARND